MLHKILISLLCIFALIGFLFVSVLFGMQFGLFNVRGSNAERNRFFLDGRNFNGDLPCDVATEAMCPWNKTPEWDVIQTALQKDAAAIERVSAETGVSKRMIASVVMPEQIRFFTSEREIFKSYFEPLKILVSLSQFSLGVSGIKQETADDIEKYANDPSSAFYPGFGMNGKIAYPPGTDKKTELYNRLTDPKDHYYSYLYTALFIREVEAQWNRAGFDVSQSPEAIVTLFNIGFEKSVPNPNPQPGGAPITVGGTTYAYGELGTQFYRSDELTGIFPK